MVPLNWAVKYWSVVMPKPNLHSAGAGEHAGAGEFAILAEEQGRGKVHIPRGVGQVQVCQGAGEVRGYRLHGGADQTDETGAANAAVKSQVARHVDGYAEVVEIDQAGHFERADIERLIKVQTVTVEVENCVGEAADEGAGVATIAIADLDDAVQSAAAGQLAVVAQDQGRGDVDLTRGVGDVEIR